MAVNRLSSIQKPRPFPFTDDKEDDHVFFKYRGVGVNRTKSASPRVSSLSSSSFVSMPDLRNCALLGTEALADEEGVFSSSPSLRRGASDSYCMDAVQAEIFNPRDLTAVRDSRFTNYCDIPSPDSITSPATFLSPRLYNNDLNMSSAMVPPSFEAPARLQAPFSSSPGRFPRQQKQRSHSIAFGEQYDAFCYLESPRKEIMNSDLPALVQAADAGLRSGVDPVMAEDSMGGCYFLRNRARAIQLVFKPSDEEMNAPNNPSRDGRYGSSYKGRIVPGFGMYRELAAFAIDREKFAGVPPTDIAKVRSPVLHETRKDDVGLVPYGYKLGSIQSYARTECSSDEMGSSKFDVGDVMRIACLDIRICNLDRHGGNILVSRSAPYQQSRLRDLGIKELSLREGSQSSSAPTPSTISANSECLWPQQKQHPSPSQSSTYRLIPIDHGFSFPHILHLSDATFIWLNWSQAKQPVPEEIKSYISSLDSEADCALIRRCVGAAIPETSLLTLKVCTKLLQYGISQGKTLYEIGCLMTVADSEDYSRLQQSVNTAIRKVVTDLAILASRVSRQSPHRKSPMRSASPHLFTSAGAGISDEALQVALTGENQIALTEEIYKGIEVLIDDI